jgi:hypothetical protein
MPKKKKRENVSTMESSPINKVAEIKSGFHIHFRWRTNLGEVIMLTRDSTEAQLYLFSISRMAKALSSMYTSV